MEKERKGFSHPSLFHHVARKQRIDFYYNWISMDTTDSFTRINNHVYYVSPLSLTISLLADPLMWAKIASKRNCEK